MAKLLLSLCFLAFFLHGSTAQFGFGSSPWESSRQGARNQCRFKQLSAQEPKRRVQSEGGVTEYFDNKNEQLNCAGVSAIRKIIQPHGLALPIYFNAPQLIYVVKGTGIAGVVIPGCPETYQSISGQQQQQQQGQQEQQREEQQGQGQEQQQREQQQREEQGRQQQGQGQEQQQHEKEGRKPQRKEEGRQEQREEQGRQQQGQGQEQQQHEEEGQEQQQRQRSSGDQHQKIIRFRQGDILAVPAGVAHWCYNDGDSPVIVVTVLDTSNNANQLDNNTRIFSLAGQTSEQDERSANNLFRGFNLEFLSNALGVSRELTKKLQQGQNGEIIRVKKGLKVVIPRTDREEKQEKESEGQSEGRQPQGGESEEQQSEGREENGLEQALCTLRFRENVNKASRADVYNPQAGRLTFLNGQKLPILNFIQMSVVRAVLFRGATLAPHWTINAHTVLYVTGGRGRIQIVSDQGRSVFDNELREGQMLVIPQHFAVVMQASDNQFEWVSFKTHGTAIPSQIIGHGSIFRGLPEDVITQSYREMSRGEARILKNQEWFLMPKSQQGQGQGGRSDA